jgi:UDPglucose 6-dehydrogenase
MKIIYIGSGFVGTCSAAVMADSGHHVLVYDIDENKISKLGSGDTAQIKSCLFEEGLGEILIENKTRISFTNNYEEVTRWLDEADAVFMCLPTPEKQGAEGESDLSFYCLAAEKLAENLARRNAGAQSKYVMVINKSTVPVNMISETAKILDKHGVKNYGVVSNPEFLVEGKALEGSIRPDRIVIGADKDEDLKIMRMLYSRFYNSPTTKYIEVNSYEAAAGKLLANYMLFNRLATTFDVVGRLCEAEPNLKFENVRKILNSDERIGRWGFYDSVYAGGSCFIKDAASLAHQLEEAGANAGYVRQTLESNRFQRDHFYSRAEKEAGFAWAGKSAAVLGLAFKRDTNDIRNSPAIDIVGHLINADAKEIRVYDPAAMPMFQNIFNPEKDPRYQRIVYCENEEQALAGSAACLILTDWPQFRQLGELILKNCRPPYLIMDGRRMLCDRFEEMKGKGYDVIAVGSPYIKGNIN